MILMPLLARLIATMRAPLLAPALVLVLEWGLELDQAS
jgi:hypothetical protein